MPAVAVVTVSRSTPLRWSCSARARRPSPWWRCREDTHCPANAASSSSPTAPSRSSTRAATASSTPRWASPSASSARDRARAVSRSRQIVRATESGSAGGSSPVAWVLPVPSGSGGSGARPRGGRRRLPSVPIPELEVDRGGRGLVRVELRPDTELLLDPLLDLAGHVGVVLEELASVLLALAQLIALVGVPGTRLAHDPLLDTHVDQRTLLGDAVPVEHVELCLLERRRYFVLH